MTAANAPNNTDGAAVLVLISGAKARELGIPVLARLRGWGEAAQAPDYFTTSPALAIPKALAHAGIPLTSVDLFEINEGMHVLRRLRATMFLTCAGAGKKTSAFSVVGMANTRMLGLDPAKVNVHGGAVALGHPLGWCVALP